MKTAKVEFRRLPCTLTAEEQRARGKTLAERVEEYNRQEADAKAAAASNTVKLKALRADISGLAEVVESGVERRDIEVAMQRDERNFSIVWYRADSGEEVERRPMTETERQQPLFNTSDA